MCTIPHAFPCLINKGILDARLPARIYVDDALLLALSRRHMELVLAALIKAIFIVMGMPDTKVCKCPLAMDKWLDLVVSSRQKMLGLVIETNKLTVGIPPDYLSEVELVLAALIEAIFVIMGTPDTTVRQCPLVMDKWLDLVVAPKQRMLGLVIDTNTLTVSIPPDYLA